MIRCLLVACDALIGWERAHFFAGGSQVDGDAAMQGAVVGDVDCLECGISLGHSLVDQLTVLLRRVGPSESWPAWSVVGSSHEQEGGAVGPVHADAIGGGGSRAPFIQHGNARVELESVVLDNAGRGEQASLSANLDLVGRGELEVQILPSGLVCFKPNHEHPVGI